MSPITLWSLGLHHAESAADWISELQETLGENLLARTLELTAGDTAEPDLTADRLMQALMTLDVVAGMQGHEANDLPPEIIDWLESHAERPSPELLELAAAAIARLSATLSDPGCNYEHQADLLEVLHHIARRLS